MEKSGGEGEGEREGRRERGESVEEEGSCVVTLILS